MSLPDDVMYKLAEKLGFDLGGEFAIYNMLVTDDDGNSTLTDTGAWHVVTGMRWGLDDCQAFSDRPHWVCDIGKSDNPSDDDPLRAVELAIMEVFGD